MALLCRARLLVALVPLKYWRNSMGFRAADGSADESDKARRLVNQVQWAATRLPFTSKCLPRAMALSWMLRRKRIGHAVVIAARPAGAGGTGDDLHAWVEVGGKIVLGELPGPWLETLRVGAER